VYRDRVSYDELAIHVAYRDGSTEVSRSRSFVRGVRSFDGSRWRIFSCEWCSDEELRRFAPQFNEELRGESEVELYKGRTEIGSEPSSFEKVLELMEALCSEAKAMDIRRCEVYATYRRIHRVIEHVEGRAEEVKHLVEMSVGLVALGSFGTPVYGSSTKFVVVWSGSDLSKVLDEAFREALERVRRSLHAKSLNPLEIGRHEVVLDSHATAALIHELSHLLDPTYPLSIRRLGVQLSTPEIEVVDDPRNPMSPTTRFFDDEAVPTARRILIEEGRIVDMHHTRATAKIHGSRPGSAHGLFQPPQPFHTVLVLKPGDWREREIVEETKHGFYIEGVAMATLEPGYVRIVPEVCYRVERGELVEAVRLRCIKIPLRMLKTVNAVGRSLAVRTSYEKLWLVSEIAPFIRLECYVE